MTLVLDCSMALSWFFEDERTPAAEAVLAQVAEQGAVVPGIWRLEVGNALQAAVRRGRVDAAFRDASISDLALLDIVTDQETDGHAWAATLQLSDRFRLTTYDAAYLELARRRDLPLASLDRELRAAARVVGTALLGE
ncbi:type II toxin-antitoxin system VapC family toxin [Geminicoccus flavidas]|uniref:type II toxin-antitoxin system VapC family toxin n=1 Tax=Geminicoccus flavidas TaxID=2506407 RepID=UPI00135B9370|nr:type II toxin-antitoxin system VapC family toxin [Geminicoccus flavidas]